MRHIVLCLVALLPGCFIDAPTYHTHDAGGDDVIDGMPVDGTPADATISTTQSPHDFGDVTTGQMSADLAVTFRNTGPDPTGTIAVTLGGSDPGEFDVVESGTDDCDGKVLAQDETCVASVRFAPGSAGSQSAALEVSAQPGGSASVSISGVGLTPGDLNITAGATLSFSTVEIQSSSTSQTLTVQNTGGTATGVLETILGDPSHYSKSNDTCDGMSLAGGDSCNVEVSFNPTTVGSHPSQISVRESPISGVAASASGTGTARLRVTKTGTGSVDSVPGGLSCADGCTTTTISFSQTPVSLTASDVSNFVFDSWSNVCASSNPSNVCSVPLTSPLTTVGATFLELFPLEISIVGSGSVTSMPNGISCGDASSDCEHDFKDNSSVVLTATPAANFEVFAWTGATGCASSSGANTPSPSCQVAREPARYRAARSVARVPARRRSSSGRSSSSRKHPALLEPIPRWCLAGGAAGRAAERAPPAR